MPWSALTTRPMPWREHMQMILAPKPCSASMRLLNGPMRAKSRSPASMARFMSLPLVKIWGSTLNPGGAKRCQNSGDEAWFFE